MDNSQLRPLIESMVGSYGWLFISGICLLFFKQGIQKIINSLFVFYGNDYNTDDIVNINGKTARIVRVGLFKTSFFVYDMNENGKAETIYKWTVDNDRLKILQLMKPLPNINNDREV